MKTDIEKSKDKLFFMKYMHVGLTGGKCYLLQVDMNQSDPFAMKDYGVYQCQWYIKTQQGMHQSPYNGMLFWGRDQRDEAVWRTWKNVARDTTQGKQFLTKVSKIVCGTRMISPWKIIGWLGHYNLGKHEEIN